MKEPVRTIMKAASLLLFGALTYAAGRWVGPLIAGVPPPSAQPPPEEGPPGRTRSGARATPSPRSALAETASPAQPTIAQPVRLPPVGTLDERIIAGDEALGRLRDDLLRKLILRSRPCRDLAQDGSTSLAVTLDVRVAAGVANVSRMAALTVTSGAPISPPVEACLRKVFADDELIRPRPLPPGTPPDQVAKYGGRWRGLGTFDGTLVLILSLSDQCDVPEPGAPS
jgi:hypothetical protein